MKHFFTFLLYFAVFSFQSKAQTNEDAGLLPIAAYDRATMWKNWAFSACIAEIYKDIEAVRKDARYTLYAYFELGEGLDIYSQLDELVKEYLKGPPYLGHTNEGGEPMLIGGSDAIKLMKCIDFYLSDTLRNFIVRHEELSNQTILMGEAIRTNDMAKLRQLFADKDLTDRQFVPMTVDLLNEAMDTDNFEAIRALIELGVDPDADNQASESALEYIFKLKKDHARHLQAMLDSGLSPDYQDSSGTPLLHRAAPSDHLGLAKLLIERGADINARDKAGKTALDRAVEQNKTELALYLAEKGAKFSDRTAEIIYAKLYRLAHGTRLFDAFIELRDRMTAQGINYLPPMPDPEAK